MPSGNAQSLHKSCRDPAECSANLEVAICANFVHFLRACPPFFFIYGVQGEPSDGILLRHAALPVALLMTKAFSIFGPGSRPQLGSFEQQVLHKLWSHGSATVRDLLADA